MFIGVVWSAREGHLRRKSHTHTSYVGADERGAHTRARTQDRPWDRASQREIVFHGIKFNPNKIVTFPKTSPKHTLEMQMWRELFLWPL